MPKQVKPWKNCTGKRLYSRPTAERQRNKLEDPDSVKIIYCADCMGCHLEPVKTDTDA